MRSDELWTYPRGVEFSKGEMLFLLAGGVLSAMPWIVRYHRWAWAQRKVAYVEPEYVSPVTVNGSLTGGEVVARVIGGVAIVLIVGAEIWFGH